MKTAQRYIHVEAIKAILFVAAAFLALFFFFDAINEVSYTARNPVLQYTTLSALTYVAMQMPGHSYELLPIAVLIGTIFVLSNMAQNSEYTILRTSGLSPGRALRSLLLLGCLFAVATYLIGDYVAPRTDKAAQLFKARFEGNLTSGRTGAWMRETLTNQNDRVLNVQQLTPQGAMRNIRVFNFGPDNSLHEIIKAASGQFVNGGWALRDVDRTDIVGAVTSAAVNREHLPELTLPTSIRQSMLAGALLEPDRMSLIELYQYVSHLKENHQSARNYEIQFWHKLIYPLSCLVMVVLALPFAYLHFRSGNIGSAVFGGIVVGISFFLLNNVFGYIGNLHHWQPWIAATVPSLFYTALSLAAFVWLVVKR